MALPRPPLQQRPVVAFEQPHLWSQVPLAGAFSEGKVHDDNLSQRPTWGPCAPGFVDAWEARQEVWARGFGVTLLDAKPGFLTLFTQPPNAFN